jgi:hypothetical protein
LCIRLARCLLVTPFGIAIQLPTVLRLEPTLRLDFIVPTTIDDQLMIQHVTSFIRTYESVWPSLRAARRQIGHPDSIEFLTIHNVSLSNTGTVEHCPYLATFSTMSLGNEFRVLVIRNLTGGGVEMPSVVFERNYPERMGDTDIVEDLWMIRLTARRLHIFRTRN